MTYITLNLSYIFWCLLIILYLFLGAYQVLQNLFGADIDEFWWFVPMTFCWSYEKNLEDAKDFIVVEPKELPSKFDHIVQILNQKRGPRLARPEVFKAIAKTMIFCASKTEIPVNSSIIARKIRKSWEQAGAYENVMLWAFWNRAQQRIILAENLQRVILSASYSTGKTTVLTGRALKIVTNPNDHSNSSNQDGDNSVFTPEKVLFINGTGITKETANGGKINRKPMKTLMSLELEEQFKKFPAITFVSKSQNEIEQVEDLAAEYPDHKHILIDEYVVETDKLTTQQIELANKIFSALAEKFKSVWIVLARCYLDEKLCTKNGHIQVQEWFPDFYVPKMTYPLRGTSPIVKFVKKNNEEMLKVLKFHYNLSIFLLDRNFHLSC